MSSISFDEFNRVLKELNPRFRTFPSRTRSSMIYLRGNYNPDCGAYGYNEVLAFPSPSHGSFPKYDFEDKGGTVGRGYTTVFRMLVRRRLVSKDQLLAFLPQALDPARGRPTRKAESDAPPPVPVYHAPVAARRGVLRRTPRQLKPA